jgi:GntR family transcriptional regulator
LPTDDIWEPTAFPIDPSRPLYEQFAEHIRFEIARGSLRPGTRLPSVRDLATRLRANPNTVMRAYQELEREELIVTYRGQGTFVTESEHAIRDSKRRIAKAAFEQLRAVADAIGMTVEDIIQLGRADDGSGTRSAPITTDRKVNGEE